MPTLTNLSAYHQAILNAIQNSQKPLSTKSLNEALSLNQRFSRMVHRLSTPKAIHDLRIQAVPICQNTKGYFYAKTTEDIDDFIKKFEKKVYRDTLELEGLKRAKENIGAEKFTMTAEFPVKTQHNSVVMTHFELDEKGDPIVPEGVNLMR